MPAKPNVSVLQKEVKPLLMVITKEVWRWVDWLGPLPEVLVRTRELLTSFTMADPVGAAHFDLVDALFVCQSTGK